MSGEEAAAELKRSARAEYFNMIKGPMYGEIDGIKFDLRHPDFPTEIGLVPPRVDENVVLCNVLIFPWDYDFKDYYFDDPAEITYVFRGDLVFTKSVRKLTLPQNGPTLDSLDDATIFILDILIKRNGNGQVIDPMATQVFSIDGAMGPYFTDRNGISEYDEIFDLTETLKPDLAKIMARLERIAFPGSRPQLSPTGWWGKPLVGGEPVPLNESELERYKAFLAQSGTQHINGAKAPYDLPYVEVYPSLYPTVSYESNWMQVAFDSIESLARRYDTLGNDDGYSLYDLNKAAAAGYAVAQAEMELGIKPLALSALKMKNGGAVGGTKRAANRQVWVSENWEPHALELAQATRARHPHMSQPDLASEILFAWKNDVESPTHSWTLNFIRKAERQNQLERRKPKVDPRG